MTKLSGRQSRASEDFAVHPPPEHGQGIEVACAHELEARRHREVAEVTGRVAPEVRKAAVDWREEPAVRRHEKESVPSGAQQAAQVPYGTHVILDVLEYVARHDRVKAPIQGGRVLGRPKLLDPAN